MTVKKMDAMDDGIASGHHFKVYGEVQRVMFRQTLMRAAQRLGLRAAATNMKKDRSAVKLSLYGPQAKVDELVHRLQTVQPLNSWGAKVEKLERDARPWPFVKHQVTTDNVDKKRWNPNVEMYL
eukprot:m.107133 g.107133  ORF g.107133 m.107133 type:complete len:124 (+) comp12685_c7_seq2:50-421(+)